MTIDSDHASPPAEPVEPEATPVETRAPGEAIAAEEAAEQPGLLPSWARIVVGLVVLIVLVYLAYPSLRERFAPVTGTPASTLAQLEQAVAADPNNDQAHYDLANVYYQAGRFADAWAQLRAVPAYAAAVQSTPEIDQAEKAVQDSPTSREAHFKLGTLWARVNLLSPAEFAFKQAIVLDDKYVDAYVNLGVVYYQLGRFSDALAQYDAALAITPDDADIHHNRGAAYAQEALQSQTPDEALLDKAVEEFQRALAINPSLPQAYFSLGVVYDLRGQKEEALAMFKRFQELDNGGDPEATAAAKTYIDKLSK
jgi:superkiller protein 3